MHKTSFPYPEKILQWIWEQQLFDFTSLKTESGKNISIVNQGTLNSGDGPDFLNASLQIDGMLWNGSIEIHTKANHWYGHGHHTDKNYDNVILHVVAGDNPTQVITKSGSQPYTLNLLPALSSNLFSFLQQYQNENAAQLPCAGNVRFISEQAFEQQIELAHQEYLEKKVQDLLAFYDPNISQSKAWKQALCIALFDGLGISKNREPMQKAAYRLIEQLGKSGLNNIDSIIHELVIDEDMDWNLKGSRPRNHPAYRLKVGIPFLQEIASTPFENYISKDSFQLWKKFCEVSGVSFSGRIKILYGTVYLPALYLLSTLVFSNRLKESVLENWNSFRAPVPESVLSPFNSISVSDKKFRNKLGSVHQLKEYCHKGKCIDCEVLKKAILP